MALQLVQFNPITKKFDVAEDAAKLLRSITGPVCIVSVCGRARQGKSFLLNQLVSRFQGHSTPSQRNGGFTVGSTVAPCTKGLWLWTRPIARTLQNGQTYHLLLVDVEGIDAFDQTADYSNQVFSLALLLSSMLIYNQMGTMDETSVDKLASVCEFVRLIRGRTDPSSPGADMLRDLSPAFIWLLRDFQFQVTEDGRQLSVQDYMEQVLAEMPGTTDALRARNQTRASIKALFPERHCHALVRPVLDEAKLARMNSLPASELRPEFRKGLDTLVELVLTRCRPKALRSGAAGGSGVAMLTGPALAGLAEAYCRVINEGQVPAIMTTWQSVVQTECRRALDAATDLYRSKMEPARAVQVGAEKLEAIHTGALDAALELFNKLAVGDTAGREAFLRRLRDTAAATVEPLRQLKRSEAEMRTTETLAAAARSLLQAINRENSDLVAAEAQLQALLRDVAADKSLGPNRFAKAMDFLAGSVIPELRRLAQAARAKAAAAEGRKAELEAKLAELTAMSQDLRSGRDAASESEARLRRELAAARSEAAAATARLAAAESRGEGSSRELAVLREQLAAARSEAASGVKRADAEAARLRSELALAKSQLAKAEAAAQQAAASRGAAVQQAAARDGELAARTAELEAARRDAAALRVEIAQVRRQHEDASARLAAREANLGHLQQERDFLQVQLDDKHRRLSDYERRLSVAAEAVSPLLRSPDILTGAGSAAAAIGAGIGAGAARPSPSPLVGGARQQGTAAAGSGGSTQGLGAVAPRPVARPAPRTPAMAAGAGEAAGAAGAVLSPPLSGHKRDREAAGLVHDPRPQQGGEAAMDVDMVDAVDDDDEDDEEFFDLTADDDVQLEATGAGDGAAADGAGGGRGGGAGGAGPSRASAGGTTAASPPPLLGRRRVTPVKGNKRRQGGAAGRCQAAGTGALEAGEQQEQERSRRTRSPVAAGVSAAGEGGGGQRQATPLGGERPARPTPGSNLPGNAAGGSARAAPGGGRRPELPANLDAMKLNDIKNWLMENGFGVELWDLNNRRAPKRDYAALVRSKCGGGQG